MRIFTGACHVSLTRHPKMAVLVSFADFVNPSAHIGFTGVSMYADCDEKEQSTDSAATDVRKDFDGRVGE
jgi:hypothetical protein